MTETDRLMTKIPPKLTNAKRVPFPETKCLTPECQGKFGHGNKGTGRGLCRRCLQQATALVKRGITTWEELENLNLAQPKYRSYYEQCFEEAKKKAKET